MVHVCVESGVPAEAVAEAYDAFEKGEILSPMTTAGLSTQTAQESMKLASLVRAYQVESPTLFQFKERCRRIDYKESMQFAEISHGLCVCGLAKNMHFGRTHLIFVFRV